MARKIKGYDIPPSDLVGEAEAKAEELKALEARNRKRKAKGRAPLPDPIAKMEAGVLSRKYRTGDRTVVNGLDAIKLFEMRKSEMIDLADEDDGEAQAPAAVEGTATDDLMATDDLITTKAVKEAEAARRVQDMKAGRIDHDGNWSDGQRLEGGDDTSLPGAGVAISALDGGERGAVRGELRKGTFQPPSDPPSVDKSVVPVLESSADKSVMAVLESFRADLYERLRVSFDGVERSLSDLQGRVAEIVTATTPAEAPGVEDSGVSASDEFSQLLEKRMPVVFDVNGTKMAFDAICVFHAPPCITVVSRADSARILPKPGAQMLLTYEMDGRAYKDDPVTFLGTRFDLPMFGLSFVGFIRDSEARMMDVDSDAEAPGTAGGADA